jgi:hypothetical protein
MDFSILAYRTILVVELTSSITLLLLSLECSLELEALLEERTTKKKLREMKMRFLAKMMLPTQQRALEITNTKRQQLLFLQYTRPYAAASFELQSGRHTRHGCRNHQH